MSNTHLIQQAAEQLWQAQQTLQPCSPVRDLFQGELDVATAYQIQQINLERAINEQKRRIVGKKIGLTSKAVQKQLGVDQPDYGSIFADMIVAEGEKISLATLLQPKVEVEVAVVLKHDLPRQDTTLVEFINAIDYVLPAIEIVDSRIENWNIRIGDTIADNASSVLVAIGQQPLPLSQVDLINATMTMYDADNQIVSQGCGAACLGNPLVAGLWLVNTMAKCNTPLQAGDSILTGALGPMVAVTQPNTYRAEIAGLGQISVSFVD